MTLRPRWLLWSSIACLIVVAAAFVHLLNLHTRELAALRRQLDDVEARTAVLYTHFEESRP